MGGVHSTLPWECSHFTLSASPQPFGRGGLGVFAFQDVPVRRFALSSLYLRFILLFHLTSGVTGSAALKHGFLSHRLLRMNVQGCHYILAICLHIEFETMTASGPVHHPSNTYFFDISIVSHLCKLQNYTILSTQYESSSILRG